jgi:hypothetical protein
MFKFFELEKANIIAIDTETCDPNLKTMGPGGFRKDGKLVGISIAILSNSARRRWKFK